MDFTLKTFIFYGFALLTIASALAVVTVRNIVHAAFALMVTLFGVAGFICVFASRFSRSDTSNSLRRWYSGAYPVRGYDDKRAFRDAYPY